MTSWLLTKLLGSIYHGRDDIMASAIEHGRVPSHQGHWDSTEELACWLSLVTALLSGQGLPQSPHHIRCHTMESPKSFYCQRREFKPLGSTSFCSISHFPIIGFGESLACFRCCACYIGWGERAGNCDIYSNILAIVPSSDENISWSGGGAGKKVGLLLGRSKVSIPKWTHTGCKFKSLPAKKCQPSIFALLESVLCRKSESDTLFWPPHPSPNAWPWHWQRKNGD